MNFKDKSFPLVVLYYLFLSHMTQDVCNKFSWYIEPDSKTFGSYFSYKTWDEICKEFEDMDEYRGKVYIQHYLGEIREFHTILHAKKFIFTKFLFCGMMEGLTK